MGCDSQKGSWNSTYPGRTLDDTPESYPVVYLRKLDKDKSRGLNGSIGSDPSPEGTNPAQLDNVRNTFNYHSSHLIFFSENSSNILKTRSTNLSYSNQSFS